MSCFFCPFLFTILEIVEPAATSSFLAGFEELHKTRKDSLLLIQVSGVQEET